MNITFDHLEKANIYRLLTHTVTPRPIAWVLTENENDTVNIAPFSYFNVVCSDPAILMFSVGHKRDGSKKDTWANIERTKRCVIHIADTPLIDAVNESARGLAYGESELKNLAVDLTQDEGFQLPRISQAPVAFDCVLHRLHLVGNGPQGVIYAEVKNAYVSDALNLEESGALNEKKLDALARLGGENYSTLGEIKAVKRPA